MTSRLLWCLSHFSFAPLCDTCLAPVEPVEERILERGAPRHVRDGAGPEYLGFDVAPR